MNSAKRTTHRYGMAASGRVPVVERSPSVTLFVNGQQAVCLLDTGADICLMSQEMHQRLGKPEISNTLLNAKGVSGSNLRLLGSCAVKVKFHGKLFELKAFVTTCKMNCDLILSFGACKMLEIIPRSFPEPAPSSQAVPEPQRAGGGAAGPEPGGRSPELSEHHPGAASEPVVTEAELAEYGPFVESNIDRIKERILMKYADVFAPEIKCMKGDFFAINLRGGVKPVCVNNFRPIPYALRPGVEQELKLLESQGIIEPVNHPTDWCSPMTVVEKKNGKVRVCVDFTRLNQALKREFHWSGAPVDVIHEVSQSGATWFSTMDAAKGYHQLPISVEHRDYTTFITPWGRFRY